MIARWFWREWRSPSLLIVWLALSLAVALRAGLGSISDRMEKGLSQQSREFMAGDRTLRSSREVPAEWIAQARKSGLTVGEQLSFATMTFAGDTPQLADVKAVDDRYPLYGTLETQPPGLKPQAGSVLLAPRLMALLNLKTGDTIDVGDATLRIAGEVIQEPDAGFNPFQMAPRLMMNMADVAKTGAVQPGSRVAWRYKFAGNAQQLADYEQWLLPKLGAEHRWTGLEQDDSALGKSLERSQQFLLLSALLTLLLAVAAIAVAMSHYCRSRYDLVAILKTLGAGRGAAAQAHRRPVAAAADAVGDKRRGCGPGAGAPAVVDAQTGAARRTTRCQRLAVAVGYRGDRRHFPAGGPAAVSTAAGDPAAASAASGCGG
ncbi:metabolite ABC transporter in Enterobacteriaceae, permease protein EC-YbbP [Klebsiella variicola]|uniref:Metabolite ABC transporter in Enterobacteriaceae, permease protein EC-YbbP n=1 Tax=Klebsiella variicola TaxID=244366 RepID=A0A7H4MEV3_KLEVA|nr:metabolite ABC transporter in Enterobacteriaceae, permease protein EC-YbbP [Klebsiella variicola]